MWGGASEASAEKTKYIVENSPNLKTKKFKKWDHPKNGRGNLPEILAPIEMKILFLALEMVLEKDCNAERDRTLKIIINGDAPEKSHLRTVVDAVYFWNLPMKLYGQSADRHN